MDTIKIKKSDIRLRKTSCVNLYSDESDDYEDIKILCNIKKSKTNNIIDIDCDSPIAINTIKYNFQESAKNKQRNYNIYSKKFCKVLDKCNNFDKLCDEFAKLKTNKLKGDYFEYFTQLFFMFDPRYKNIVKYCWLLKELPIKTCKKLCIPKDDQGIDLIIETFSGEYIAVQSKFQTDKNSNLSWKKLSTFYGLCFGRTNKFSKGIVFSNVYNTSSKLESSKNVINILYYFLKDTTKYTFTRIKEYVNNTYTENICESIEPRNYQKEIVEKAVDYFENNDRGILYMPCGTGKTLTSFWIALNLKYNNKICIAVPSLYLLSQFYHTWSEMYNCKYLLVCSDTDIESYSDIGLLLTTQVDEIEDYLEKYKDEQIIIITTYQSSERLAEACYNKNIIIDICIFDEAHKTTGRANKNFAFLLHDSNILIKKRLAMTATEKIYNGETNTNIISMNDKNIYGKVIYTYSLKQAIEQKQLCDYKIIAPLITDESFWNMVKKNKLVIDKELCIDPIEIRYYMTAYLIIRAIKERKLTHILTFNNTNENAKILHELLINLIDFYDMDCNCYHLTGRSSIKKRRKVVNDFINDEIAIISSAYIFTEGVDIPIVDCVCFCDNKMSVVDIIQSVGRTLRKHQNKDIGYVIIPTIINIKENKNNLFDISTYDFYTIKNVIQSLGTTDKRVIAEFDTIHRGKTYRDKAKFILDKKDIELYSDLDVNICDFKNKIMVTIYAKNGKEIWTWEKSFDTLVKWINDNYRLPSNETNKKKISPLESRLGKFCTIQRSKFKKGKLDNVQIQKFNQINETLKQNGRIPLWYWNKDEMFDIRYYGVIEFIKNNNGRLPNKRSNNEDEKKLGIWITARKYDKIKGRLSQDRVNKLEQNLGWVWNKSDNFNEIYNELVQWINTHHKLPSQKAMKRKNNKNMSLDELEQEKRLGIWCATQRKNYDKKDDPKKRNPEFSEDRVQKLESISLWKWSNKAKYDSFHDTFNEIIDWYNIHGKYPSYHYTKDKNKKIIYKTENRLATWLVRQRNYYKNINNPKKRNNLFTKERIELLKSVKILE